MLERPASRGLYGFSCKVWIAYQLEKQFLGGTYFVWFARELNPLSNGDSSNPLIIYADFDRAVKKRDLNHPKIKDFRARLLDVIARLVKPKDPYLARALRKEVLSAPIESFRPQLWQQDCRKPGKSRPIVGGLG
jgi:hypothetical protein